MRIVGLDHVQLAMPPGGEERARAFYGGVLGLPEAPKPPALAARGGCWFDNGAAQLHLGIEPDFAPARRAHPALLVEDLDEAARVLEAARAPARRDDSVEGVHRLYTEDPFGNRLELIQTGDGFSQR